MVMKLMPADHIIQTLGIKPKDHILLPNTKEQLKQLESARMKIHKRPMTDSFRIVFYNDGRNLIVRREENVK